MSNIIVDNPPIRKVAMFMVGFTILMPIRITLSCSKYVIVRFQLPLNKIGLFINQFHNPMEIASLSGALLSNIMIWLTAVNKDLSMYLSIVTNWLMFVASSTLVFSYYIGGHVGNLTLFYWSIIFYSFIYGCNQSFSMNVDSKNAALNNAGIPFSGLFISIYHFGYLYLSKVYNWTYIEFWIVIIQILIIAFLSFITATLWTFTHLIAIRRKEINSFELHPLSSGGENRADDGVTRPVENGVRVDHEETLKEFKTSHEQSNSINRSLSILELLYCPGAWSPILLCVFSLGTVYAFYPSIAPYSIIDPERGYKIDLIVLILSIFPGLIICGICENGIGPDKKWHDIHIYWHLTWVLILPYFICIILSLFVLHYPETTIANFLYNNIYLVGILTIVLNFCKDTCKGVGFAAASKQGLSVTNGDLTTFAFLLTMLVMNISMFMGDGYLKTYRKYDRDYWPTNNMSLYDSLKFWTRHSLSNSIKAFKSSFTLNLRQTFMGNDLTFHAD